MVEATNYIRQLEVTNRKHVSELEQIRPIAQKAAINVEKIHSLETQLSLMEDLRRKCTELEIEVALLRKEKNAWNTFLESTDGVQRPEEITRELQRERAAHKFDQEQMHVQETELDELRKQLRTLEQSVDSLKSELQMKQEQLTKTERRYERLDRQRSLAQKEVQLLKDQLRTYDSEETTFLNGAGLDLQKQARIEKLENLVDQYKAELDRVNKEGLLPAAAGETGKRKRASDEEDEEQRRKIRILQNGTYFLLAP